MVRFIAVCPLTDLTIVVQMAETTWEKYARAPKSPRMSCNPFSFSQSGGLGRANLARQMKPSI